MTLSDLRKTPFPWFGGKADAAPAVWEALGDVDHYCEPFAGSLARGVSRKLPHVSDGGRGVNHPQTREPGADRKRPHVSDDGMGVNQPQMRELGVGRQRPHISNNGMGVNQPQMREPGAGDEPDYHPMTMPELRRWMRFLSARLRHVRILNGDWTRLATSGALQSLPVRQGGHAGIFLDPPYSHDVRAAALYAHESATVADEVRAWCLENGGNPRYRIVLAGYVAEHGALEAAGWRSVEWFRAGFLKGGYAQQGEGGTNQHRERLWLSPHCLGAAKAAPQIGLFDGC